MNRRQFQTSLAALAAAALLPRTEGHASTPAPAPQLDLSSKKTYQVAMLVYPGMTALDLIGPQYAFASIMGAEVSLVAKTTAPVRTDTGVTLVPDRTFQQCPAQLDILFIPGGSRGTVAAMNDPETVAFVKDRGSRATWVTSVCTGSLILGAAGLLQGRRATSHWLVRDNILPLLGAQPINQRVVIDGNRMTGAGVSAGLDLGLTLVAKIKGEDYARAVQLMEEYDPQPPFHAGSPQTAGPAITRMMVDMHQQFLDTATSSAHTAATHFNTPTGAH
jgi:putative intracellular protease/amidase